MTGSPWKRARDHDQMILLITSLKLHWADRSGYYVGGDMFVHYDPSHKRCLRGPDFFLVLGVWPWERAGDLLPHRAPDGMATGVRQRPATPSEEHDGAWHPPQSASSVFSPGAAPNAM
jgi:hypothetical protein